MRYTTLAIIAALITAQPAQAEDKVIHFDDVQMSCLADAVFFEARGETYQGQFAVFNVVMQRIIDNRWPDTACGVVYQKKGKSKYCQFTFACEDKKSLAYRKYVTENELYVDIVAQAGAWLDAYPFLVQDGVNHYARSEISNKWTRAYERVKIVGAHSFYKG